MLDPAGLEFNGGLTQTIALEVGSPAINAGDNIVCLDPASLGGLSAVDQRGFPRFFPFDGNCDIGAFELRRKIRSR